jgi:aspartokinase
MAESVSSHVKRIVDKSPFIHEMLVQGILSYSNYAENIRPDVEKLNGSPVKSAAIVMALRRYADELKGKEKTEAKSNVDYQIVMKTNIFDLNLVRRDSFISKLGSLYSKISPEKGDFLNVSLGSHEISLAVSEKYRPLVEELSKGEEILHKMVDLVALTLVFTGDFLQTPGIVYEAVRRLAWEEINVIEIVSTMNELTFVINRSDSMSAFDVLQSFLATKQGV